MEIVLFEPFMQDSVTDFFAECFKALERDFEPSGRHIAVTDVSKNYMQKGCCWCLVNNEIRGKIFGTSAIKKLDKNTCELKMMYVLPEIQGLGWGKLLLETAIEYAKAQYYKSIRLDSLFRNKKAISLYTKYGFKPIERYNENTYAEVFMEKIL